MKERFDHKLRVALGEHPLIGFWMSGKDNIISLGLSTRGLSRNIHLTTFIANECLKCEVSDYEDGAPESKKVVWESDALPISDIELTLLDLVENSILEYDEDDEYEELGNSWVRIVDDFDYEGRKVVNFDVMPLIRSAVDGTLLHRRRITDSYQQGTNFGTVLDKKTPLFIIPCDETRMLALDISPNGSLFNVFPIAEGMHEYFQHIERVGVIEEYFRKNLQPKLNIIEAAIMGVLTKKEKSEIEEKD